MFKVQKMTFIVQNTEDLKNQLLDFVDLAHDIILWLENEPVVPTNQRFQFIILFVTFITLLKYL